MTDLKLLVYMNKHRDEFLILRRCWQQTGILTGMKPGDVLWPKLHSPLNRSMNQDIYMKRTNESYADSVKRLFRLGWGADEND